MAKVEKIIRDCYQSSFILQNVKNSRIRKSLLMISSGIEKNALKILNANAKDVAGQDSDDPRIDRLLLTKERIKNISKALRTIASLPCPAGQILEQKTLANGLQLEKRTVPLGVVAAVYESRPNVTFDIAALCLRSKNACLLKGSKEALHTNEIAVSIIREALKANNIPPTCVNLLPANREVLTQLFSATKYVDVIIPRGSAGLIEYVRKNSLVPTIETGAGVCHIYVEKEANLTTAVDIVEN